MDPTLPHCLSFSRGGGGGGGGDGGGEQSQRGALELGWGVGFGVVGP